MRKIKNLDRIISRMLTILQLPITDSNYTKFLGKHLKYRVAVSRIENNLTAKQHEYYTDMFFEFIKKGEEKYRHK